MAPIPGKDYIGVTAYFCCHDGQGNFLMHKRSDSCRDEQGRWDFGGGKVEFGESLREAALREVREEYGCEGVIEEQLPASSSIRFLADGTRTHWIGVGFIVKVDRQEARANEPAAMAEIGWFKLDGMPSPLHTAVEVELKDNLKALRRYA